MGKKVRTEKTKQARNERTTTVKSLELKKTTKKQTAKRTRGKPQNTPRKSAHKEWINAQNSNMLLSSSSLFSFAMVVVLQTERAGRKEEEIDLIYEKFVNVCHVCNV